MATISSKLLVQLPALPFSVFVIVMSMQAWSNDYVTTYKLTAKNGETSRMVIRERIRNGLHLYLSRTQSNTEAREVTHQDVTDVVGMIPEPDNSGHHRMFNLPPSPERGAETFSNPLFFEGARRVVMPSYGELSKLLLPPPDAVKRCIYFVLPIPPLSFPVQSEGASQVMELDGYIHSPVVTASANNATLTVSGVMQGLTRGSRNTGTSYSPIASENVSVTAVFTLNRGGERLQMERFEIGEYLTFERESFRESGERDEIFEAHWDQFERREEGIARELHSMARIPAFLNSLSQ